MTSEFWVNFDVFWGVYLAHVGHTKEHVVQAQQRIAETRWWPQEAGAWLWRPKILLLSLVARASFFPAWLIFFFFLPAPLSLPSTNHSSTTLQRDYATEA